jgi:hypothetical protein
MNALEREAIRKRVENSIYVSLCIDHLGARNDPTKSDRVATYTCTPEEIATIMEIIKRHKGEHKNVVGFPIESKIELFLQGTVHHYELEKLLKTKLDQAKQADPNMFCWDSEMYEKALANLKSIQICHRLNLGDFRIEWQPIIWSD